MSTGRMLLREIYVGFLLLLLTFLYLSQLTREAHEAKHDLSRQEMIQREFQQVERLELSPELEANT